MSARALATALLALCATALAALVPYANGWAVDNRLAAWAELDPGYAELVRAFGGDEFVLVRADGIDGDGARDAWLDGLGERLAALPAVSDVLDPLHLPGAPADGASVARRLERAAARPLARALDLVGDGRADLLLGIRPAASSEERRALAREVGELEAEAARLGLRLRSSGHPLVAAALDEEALAVERVFGPLFAVAGFLATAVALRCAWLALAALLPAALASVAVRAALRAIDVPANMIVVAAGPLVLVLVVASVLHQVAAFRRLHSSGLGRPEAARAARREVLRTALFAGVTTAMGFGVFALAPVPAVRRLGTAVAVAVLVAVPLAHAALPLLLAGLPARRQRAAASHPRPWRRLAAFAARRRRGIVAAAAALFAGGALAVPGLRFGTNALDYFPAGHRERDAFVSIEAEGGALSGVDVLVASGEGLVERSGELSALLAGVPGVVGVVGPDTVAADVRAVSGPLAPLLRDAALERAGRVDPDGRWLRFTARARTAGAEEVRALAAELERRAVAWSGEGRAYATGSVVELLGVQEKLVGTLATSLGGTAAFVGLCFLLAAGRLALFAAAMSVNLWPVPLVLWSARLLDYSLDAATVMVASVAMGLAVDNTFHLLSAGRPWRGSREGLAAFGRVGDAAAASSLALLSGFALLAASPFVPTARFGVLSAIGVAAAFAGDFLLLPALLLRGGRSDGPRALAAATPCTARVPRRSDPPSLTSLALFRKEVRP